MERFQNALAHELHAKLENLALGAQAQGWPKNCGYAFKGLARWWAQYKGIVGGPGDLLALISEAAGIGANWEYHKDPKTWFRLDGQALAHLLARFSELEVGQVVQATAPIVQVTPPAPAPAVQAQPVQAAAQGSVQISHKARAATIDQVELGLAKLEEALGPDEVQGLSQAELIRGLGELGVSTTDRTLRETAWWGCRQDRRAEGKRRLSSRRGRG